MSFIHTVVLPANKERTEVAEGKVIFVGTATVLLRYAGFTILTDPNFIPRGEKVHLGFGLKSERLLNPALTLDQLPPLDLVLLSHLHEDHFDRLVAEKLPKSTIIVTNPQAAAGLRKMGFSYTYALPTWDTLTVVKDTYQLNITAMPARHGPGPIAKVLPSVMGSMLDFSRVQDKKMLRVYVSGDTLMYPELEEIPKRYDDIDLGILHLGGTKIAGILVTMDAKQGVEALKLIKPHEALPVHFNDYTVFKSPLDDFKKAVQEAGLSHSVHYLHHGEIYTFTTPANRVETTS